MELRKKALSCVVIFFLVFTTAYFIVITADIQYSSPVWVFNWNPPEETRYYPLLLSFPNAVGTSMTLGGNGENTTLCVIKLLLKYQGDLTEDTKIEVENATCITCVSYGYSASVLFPNAIYFDYKSQISDTGFGLLKPWAGIDIVSFRVEGSVNANSNGGGNLNVTDTYPSGQNPFYFPISGDYSPIIEIKKDDGNTTVYSYDQIKLHIVSKAEVEQQKINKTNFGLSIALFGFAILGGIGLLHEFLKKDEFQCPISTKIAPIANSTDPDNKEATITQSGGVPNNESKQNINNIPPKSNR